MLGFRRIGFVFRFCGLGFVFGVCGLCLEGASVTNGRRPAGRGFTRGSLSIYPVWTQAAELLKSKCRVCKTKACKLRFLNLAAMFLMILNLNLSLISF